MAAGKFKVYDLARKRIADGTFDLDDTSPWKIALFTSGSNCNNLISNSVYSDLTSEHANANGYTTGGIPITGVTWTQTGGIVTFNIDNPVFTASGGSIVAKYAVIYKNATVNSIVKPLLCVCLLDTVSSVNTTNGNTLTLVINPLGVFNLSGADTD